MNEQPLLNSKQLASILGVAQATISYWLAQGIIPAEIHEGRVIRFDLTKVREALAKRAAEKAKDPS